MRLRWKAKHSFSRINFRAHPFSVLTVVPSTASLPGKTQPGSMFSPAAVIFGNRSPRLELNDAFVRQKKPPTKQKTLHFKSNAVDSTPFQTAAECKTSYFAMFCCSSFPPTPWLVLRGRVHDWLRTALLKCLRISTARHQGQISCGITLMDSTDARTSAEVIRYQIKSIPNWDKWSKATLFLKKMFFFVQSKYVNSCFGNLHKLEKVMIYKGKFNSNITM